MISGQPESGVVLLTPASCANTAAATTSTFIDTSGYKGMLQFVQMVGALTGSIAGKLQKADDTSGTNAADIAGATFTSVSSANNVQVLELDARVARFIGYVGTIGTGPAVVGVAMVASAGQAG